MSAITRESPPAARLARSWSLLWRIGFSVLVGVSAFAVVYGTAIDRLDPDAPPPNAMVALMALDVVLGPVAVGLLALRRRAGVAAGIVVMSTVSTLALGAGLLAAVSFAAARPMRSVVALGAVFTTLGTVPVLVMPEPDFPWWVETLGLAAGYAVLVLVGRYVRSRRLLIESLRAQAASAEREQEARADIARRAERARIAREMHDALGHRLSVIAMHAGVLESRPDLAADDTRTAARVVRESVQQAMSELRDVLGVLNEPSSSRDDGSDLPALDQLDELVAAGVGGGVVPVVHRDPSTAHLPPTVSRHLFRAAQEALTNVRKHAPGEPTELRLELVADDLVELLVRNRMAGGVPPMADDVPRHGLAGLAERARLAGGSLSAGADGPDFVVRMVLPCRS